MKRGMKKFFYGLFYLGIFTLFCLLIYNSFIKPAPTCFDGIKNQNEQDVDCGGPCVPCEILHLKPLKANEPQLFSLADGKLAILTEIFNPNEGYGADQFSYQINLYDRNHRLIKTIKGSDFIFDLSRRYIFASDPFLGSLAVEAEISLGSPIWKSNKEMLRPDLRLSSQKTEITPSGIETSGRIYNGSILAASEVKILAILKDKFGRPLFVGQTFLAKVESLKESDFMVIFPQDKFLEQNVDVSQTQIFLSGRL